MYSYHTNNLVSEVQRLINQLQQNERNNANTLRSLANQLQNLAATETQATAMLQQLQSMTAQLATEASRTAQTAFPYTTPSSFEPVRSNVNVGTNLTSTSSNAGVGGSASTPFSSSVFSSASSQQSPFGQS